jgi:RNA polymerase sigma-70 factor (ECF subfamily)
MGSTMTGARHQQFEALLDQHRRIVFKIANVYARGAEDGRDLAQDIATQLWRAFESYDERRGKFSTWMYRIALNVAISHARRGARSGRFEPLEDHHLGAAADPARDDAGEADGRLRAMYAFIGELDPLNRALVVLYLEDRTYAEIAEVLGISETNVATKLNRLRNKLRGQLAATGA